jgi:RND family efflux transporter MFP subunit
MATALKIIPLFLAALIGGLVASWMGGRHAPPPRAAPWSPFALSGVPSMLGADVTQMPSSARIELGGYVEPRHVVRLAAQQPGRVTFVAGQEGDRVGAGQLVVALDDAAMQPEYRAAWAQLSGDMAAYENAQTQLFHNLYGQRTSPMGGPGYEAYERMAVPFYNMAQSFMNQFAPGMSSGPFSPFGGGPGGPMMTQGQSQRSAPAINNARAQYEQQVAGLVGSQAKIDMLDARLRDRRAITPRAGVILKRLVRVGDVVQPGQPLAEIGDVDALDVRIEVPVAQMAQIKLGDQVPVTLNNANIWAPVSQIFPVANESQRTVTVKLALPPGAPAAAGMYARAWIAQPGGGSPSALTPAIPQSAIVYRGSLPAAFAITSRGTVEMRVLRLGDAMGDRIAVLSGLQAGEKVVLDPSPDMRSGDSLFNQQQ